MTFPTEGPGRVRRRQVRKAAATLPATTTQDLFTVSGRIRAINLVGLVTTVVQTQANNTKLIFHPTTGSDVDLCAVLNITAFAVNTVLAITGTVADAIVSGLAVKGQVTPLELGPGIIRLSCAATNTGATSWTLDYESVDGTGSAVSA